MPKWSFKYLKESSSGLSVPSPSRLDRWVLELLEAGLGHWNDSPVDHFSRTRIQKLFEQGAFRINGNPCLDGKAKVKFGDHLEIEVDSPRILTEVLPENIPIPVLFEDEDLIVVNKPPGLTVHPSVTQINHTLVNALLYQVQNLSGIGGVLRPGIVHRMDKDTSGALVVSKKDSAHHGLADQFAVHSVDRKYWALCFGSFEPASVPLRLETYFGRNPKDRKKMAVVDEADRKAITHLTPLRYYRLPNQKKSFCTLVEASLQTGRTHQVRVHLTHLGYSLLGDPVYGTPTSTATKWKSLPGKIQALTKKLPGQALHARTLGFIHPRTLEKKSFEAPLFADFQALLNTLEEFRLE